MNPNKMNPAAGARADGARNASLGGARSEDSTARKSGKPALTVWLDAVAAPVTVHGREAQTLALLIQKGAAGFTSGEASPLGWARRTSHYIFKLRGLGFPIVTAREPTPDGSVVARYSLAGRVCVVSKGGEEGA